MLSTRIFKMEQELIRIINAFYGYLPFRAMFYDLLCYEGRYQGDFLSQWYPVRSGNRLVGGVGQGFNLPPPNGLKMM